MVSCCICDCDVTYCNNPEMCTFHRLPVDPTLRQKWIKIIARPNWIPSKYSTVCSKHFEEKYVRKRNSYTILMRGAIPTLFVPKQRYRVSLKRKADPLAKKRGMKRKSGASGNTASGPAASTSRPARDTRLEVADPWNLPVEADLNSDDDISDDGDEASMFEEMPAAKKGKGAKPHTATSSSYTNVGTAALHEGFQCNVCAQNIIGFRYTCVQCADYDMCSACEWKGSHADHYVLRVPGPRPYMEVHAVLERIRKQLEGVAPAQQRADDEEEYPGSDGGKANESIVKVEVKVEVDQEPDPLQGAPSYASRASETITGDMTQARPWTVPGAQGIGKIKIEVESDDETPDTTEMDMPLKRHAETTHDEPPKRMHIEINSGYIVKSEPLERLRSVVSGQGTVLSGQGTVLSGQGTVLSGQGTVLSGQGSVLSGQGSVVSGQGSVVPRQGNSGQFACEVFSHSAPGGSTATDVAGPSKQVTKNVQKKAPVPGKKEISAKKKNKLSVEKMASSGEDSDLEEIDEKEESMVDNLPLKSQKKYLRCYRQFTQWKNKKNEQSYSESVFLTYFNELAQTLKPSSLWSHYAMLKATVKLKQNICFGDYATLTALLKKLGSGYKSEQSKVLTAEDVEKFLKEAPDEKYLAVKVALIFGVNGGCKTTELAYMTTKNIEIHNQMMLVNLPNTKIDRAFVVRDEMFSVVGKYQALRPRNVGHDRFFLNYQKGKCLKQPMGRHKMATLPKEIATYLSLPNAESYTGHCFRRTSASLLAGVRRHGWKSEKGLISIEKSWISNQLTELRNLGASASTEQRSRRPTSDAVEIVLENPSTPLRH